MYSKDEADKLLDVYEIFPHVYHASEDDLRRGPFVVRNEQTQISFIFGEQTVWGCDANPEAAVEKLRKKIRALRVDYNAIVIYRVGVPGGKSPVMEYQIYAVVGCANVDLDPVRLTHKQKLEALAFRFYQDGKWEPKKGDFYTTSRADLELYKIVDESETEIFTSYLPLGGVVANWPKETFATGGFGPKRVWVPPFILER